MLILVPCCPAGPLFRSSSLLALLAVQSRSSSSNTLRFARMASSSANGHSSASTRTYADAIDCLNSLQSNAAAIEQVRVSGNKFNDKLIPETIDYLKRVGYKADDLNALNVIHITGTKGKGSSSAFCSSLLTALAPTAKVGLFTSPHMVSVCERIRINGKPLEEEKFARYFFEVWDRLEENRQRLYDFSTLKPAYFRYLTIMAYHVFLSEKVDATILEVGIGGTYDTTNIVPRPITTGITALGLDHVTILGKTIEAIAHQKGGIYKKGVPALSIANQPPAGLEVLKERAAELQASSFSLIDIVKPLERVQLGLAGTHQISNASLALALLQSFLSSAHVPAAFSQVATDLGSFVTTPLGEQEQLPKPIIKALENARWPGRCHIIPDRQPERKNVTWHLDGAHTAESLQLCGEWFAEVTSARKSSRRRVLIFNCTNGRSGEVLLGALTAAMAEVNQKQGAPSNVNLFDDVIFCTNVTYTHGGFKSDLSAKAVEEADLRALTVQHELADSWTRLVKTPESEVDNETKVHVLPSIQHAVNLVAGAGQDGSQGVDVLVTGSLHLIGGIFEVAKLKFAL